MGADVDLRKGAVVLGLAMVCALGYGTADALVCVHLFHLAFLISFLLFAFLFVLCGKIFRKIGYVGKFNLLHIEIPKYNFCQQVSGHIIGLYFHRNALLDMVA